ncbi:MAG: biopolymer transporter ExbB [Verrucomicrobiales bacterium]|nr:biopolymer transporter ExbB [Verrucomicrobiales bacterium]
MLLFPPRLRARRTVLSTLLLMLAGITASWAEGPANWWKPEWTARKKITINTGAEGVGLPSPPGSPAVLVRLSSDFAFGTAKEDGSDLRFVSGDNKTLLPFHIERWDNLLNEAVAWVKVPDLKINAATDIWLYYGNPAAERASDPKATYDEDTLGVYHFSENGGAPADSSPAGVNAEGIAVPVATALIGGGVRFTGQNSLTIPANPALGWTAGGALTVSIWVKPATLGPNAIILSRRENGQHFLLGMDAGAPFMAVKGANEEIRSPGSPAMSTGTWHHLAVTALNGTFTLYVDGESRVTLTSALPGLAGPISIGRDDISSGNVAGFAGELDELEISKITRSAGAIKLAAVNQGGTVDAAKLLTVAAEEASGGGEHSEIAEHLNLIRGISKSLTFDGWVVIWLCTILAVIGWAVAIGKVFYLNRIAKSSKVFLKQWKTISNDITALDHTDEDSVRSMGGGTNSQDQRAMWESPLFHLYHLGSQEIQHRITNARGDFKGLSERSITSIRALLDGGATRETQKLQSKLVFLTIGIAGGPYLGLLGTVIGVMITFAVIAKSGEVDINSIAPGIAGALLATVAGLAVAIPALFAYSYLASRIKDSILSMNTFIEEFIARIAEAYPSND